jgi:hypothetical protein
MTCRRQARGKGYPSVRPNLEFYLGWDEYLLIHPQPLP